MRGVTSLRDTNCLSNAEGRRKIKDRRRTAELRTAAFDGLPWAAGEEMPLIFFHQAINELNSHIN